MLFDCAVRKDFCLRLKASIVFLSCIAASTQLLLGCVTSHTNSPDKPPARRVSIVAPAQQPLEGYGYADGQLLIKFKAEAAKQAARLAGKETGRLRLGILKFDRLCTKYKARRLDLLPGARGNKAGPYLLYLAPDANIVRAAEGFTANPDVEYAEPNYRLVIPEGGQY